jgi:uncharacterized membrane protein
MFIEQELLSAGTRIVTTFISLASLTVAATTAPWRSWLLEPERQRVWLASLLLLFAIWSMKAGVTPGLSVHFLMMTALTLMHGWQFASIGAALILLAMSLTGQADWASFGANLLCAGVVPALFTAWFHELIHDRLPHNYFIYFFLTTFLGSALAFNLAGLARLALVQANAFPAGRVVAEYIVILPLMSFGEGVVNGMVIAMAVVYRPRWVMSFDDRLYLRPPRRSED